MTRLPRHQNGLNELRVKPDEASMFLLTLQIIVF